MTHLFKTILVLLAFLPAISAAQQAPRQLTEQDMERLRQNVANSKERVIQAERRRHEEERRRQEEEALVFEEEWEDDIPQQTSGGGFAAALAHGMGVFSEEMAKKQAEDAKRQAFLNDLRRQAEGIERQRQRELIAREREREERQEQMRRAQTAQLQLQPVGGDGNTTSTANAAIAIQQAAQLREQQLREQVAAERKRQQALQEQRLASERADVERQRQAEQRRLAEEQARQRRQQELQQSLQNLRSSFQGAAITCAGGGKDVLYLKSSVPPKTGCNSVRATFEARCPGTPPGAGVRFSRGGYIGGHCGSDIIRIGQMSCPAEQVMITMTDASCG